MIAPLIARVTHLEMTERHTQSVPVPTGMRLAIIRACHMPVHYYRYLYEQVGRPHHWMLRRMQSDSDVEAIIQADTCEIHVLYVDGSPAGFVEINLMEMPDIAEILYFGLVPEFQGRGLAKFFLNEAIATAWARDPYKITIHTNTLDSPRALQLYQKMGFSPIGWSEEEVLPWD